MVHSLRLRRVSPPEGQVPMGPHWGQRGVTSLGDVPGDVGGGVGYDTRSFTVGSRNFEVETRAQKRAPRAQQVGHIHVHTYTGCPIQINGAHEPRDTTVSSFKQAGAAATCLTCSRIYLEDSKWNTSPFPPKSTEIGLCSGRWIFFRLYQPLP